VEADNIGINIGVAAAMVFFHFRVLYSEEGGCSALAKGMDAKILNYLPPGHLV
jgi:hypothetical protein